LWGDVSNKQIICSCPVVHSTFTFEVMGPKPCPTTQAAYDAVCGVSSNALTNGAITYIGGPGGLGFQDASACWSQVTGGPTVTLNTCTRPAK
jgi:hypothetical protein